MAVKFNQKREKKKLNVFNFYGYTASLSLLTIKHTSSDLSSAVRRTETDRTMMNEGEEKQKEEKNNCNHIITSG